MSESASARQDDDEYAINLALTCYRDAINDGDVDAAMTVIGETFSWMYDGEPSFWGGEGRRAVQAWIRRMVSQSAHVTYTPINSRIIGAFALSSGWEKIDFPGSSGAPQNTHRYFQTWEKSPDGRWR